MRKGGGSGHLLLQKSLDASRDILGRQQAQEQFISIMFNRLARNTPAPMFVEATNHWQDKATLPTLQGYPAEGLPECIC